MTISTRTFARLIATLALIAGLTAPAALHAQGFFFASNQQQGGSFDFQGSRLYDTVIHNRTNARLTVLVDGQAQGTLGPGSGWRTEMRPNAEVEVRVGNQFKKFRINQNQMTVNVGNFGWQRQTRFGQGGDFGQGVGGGFGRGNGGGFGGGGSVEPDGSGQSGGSQVTAQQLQLEAQRVMMQINQHRRQAGLDPIQWNNILGQVAQERANSMASQARTMNDLFAATEHIPMNAKVRAAGYPLPSYMVDTANNVESTYGRGEQPVRVAGSAMDLVNGFMGEGPGGGHYQAIMNPNAKDMAAAFAVNARGDAIVGCVLVVRPLE